MNKAQRVLSLCEELSIGKMEARLKKDGIWIASLESVGVKHLHSQWWLYWNDRDGSEIIKTDGTDGGSSKAWQKRLAKEQAIAKRFKEEYPNE